MLTINWNKINPIYLSADNFKNKALEIDKIIIKTQINMIILNTNIVIQDIMKTRWTKKCWAIIKGVEKWKQNNNLKKVVLQLELKEL